MAEERTVASFARDLALHGDAVALILPDGVEVSYAGLAARADEIALTLPATPTLLALEMRRDLQSVATYLAALRCGHAVILLESLGSELGRRIVGLWEPWTFGSGEPKPHVLHPDLAVLLSTSGTTGSPKLVRLSHRNIEANARSIAAYLEIDSSDRALTSLPFFYSYGLSVLNSHLQAGASLVLTEGSASSPEFRTLIDRQSVTSIAGVPFTYELFESVGLRDAPLSSLRKLTQAGGRLSRELVKTYADWAAGRGIRFFVMYGQTEATARMAYLPPELAASHSDCIGVAIPGGEFSLLPVDDPARPGVGELVYRGPNVMMGYAERPADLALGTELEALHTGDLAECTPEGLYRIVGRLSRFSKLFGLRISHDEVERFLATQRVDAVVTGDDEAVFVLSTADRAGPAPQVEAVLAERFALPESCFVHQTANAIPRLPSGKTDYVAVRKLYEAAPREPAQAGITSIDGIFAAIFPRVDIEEGDSFTSLGGDSLSYVNFSIALEKLFGHAPDGWENLTAAQLKALKPASSASGQFRAIDSDILVRAAAIIGVVLLHAGAPRNGWPDLGIAGGASVLMVLMGYNLARFQQPNLLSPGRWKVVTNFLSRIMLPYYLLLIAYTLLRQDFFLPSFLLVSNYVGRFGSTMEPFWFLEAAVQSLLFVTLLFAVPWVRDLLRRSPSAFAIALVAVSLALKLAGDHLFDQKYLEQRTFDATFCYVAAGWAAWTARTLPARIAAYLLCVGISLYSWGWGDAHINWMAISMALVLFLPRLRLPLPVVSLTVIIASASFYIYLVHSFVIYGLEQVLNIHFQLLTVLLSVIAGVLFWMAREKVLARPAGRDKSRLPTGGGQPGASARERA